MEHRGCGMASGSVETVSGQEDDGGYFLVHSALTMTHMPGQVPDLPQKALEALWRGERSEAIEQVQLERNLGVEEARELVATYIMSQPALQRRMKDSQSETRWGIMRWLIMVQAIAVALGYFLLFRDQ